MIEISAKTLIGLDLLENLIEKMFDMNNIEVGNEVIVTNLRHKNLIEMAKNEIIKVQVALKSGLPIDMISIELQNAVQHLAEIVGESVSEDVVSGIFQRFCVGK